MTLDELLDAWRANQRINLELLELCSDEDLDLKPVRGKTIRSNFVHITGVRRAHIEEKMKEEAQAIPRPDWKTATRAEIVTALEVSHDLMAELFRRREERTRPDRWTSIKFLAYNVAHEAHHRSQIEMALRLNGREPDDATLYRLWEWPKK
jgi:uncharacterized damage-inducible protein DinB